MLNSKCKSPSSLAYVLPVLMTLPALAQADVKIVTEVTTTGSPSLFAGRPASVPPAVPTTPSNTPPNASAPGADVPTGTYDNPAPSVVTTWYRGKNARTEITGGIVAIYDGKANKVYLLNPDEKTYAVTSLKDAWKQLPGYAEAQLNRVPSGAHLALKADLDATGLTKTVVDRDTTKYTLIGSAQMVRDDADASAGGHGGGGGFPSGGGGFPSGGGHRRGGRGGGSGGGEGRGGGGNRPQGNPNRPNTAFDMEGEYWLTSPTLLPEGSKALLLPLVMPTLPPASAFKTVGDKLQKLKLLPLASSVTLRLTLPNGSTQRLVTTTEVKSIQEDELPDTLFTVPADYRKIDANAALRQSRVSQSK